MKNLFLSVLNLSITASYVILAILIVRFLLRRAPRKYSYMLWAIAAVRLICPFSFTAPMSVLSYAPAVSRSTQGMPVTQMVYFEPAPSIDVEFEDLQPTTVRPLVTASPDYMRIMAFIWIAVVAGMMVYGVYAYIKVGRTVKNAVPQENNVYVCTNISSPFVFGIILPRIFLTEGLSDEEKEVILAHERYHIKRCDHLIKILAYILTCIYWFHPLVWLSFYLMQRDMEMSCDEHVLMSHNKVARSYSNLLLGFAEGKPSFYAPLSFGENDISSRIKNILHFRKPRRLTTILCIVLMVITCAACLTNPSSSNYRYCRDDLCIVVPPGTSYKESVLSEDGKEVLPAEGNEEDRFLSDKSLNSTIYFSTFEHFNYMQFETEDEEFKYLCDLSKESIDDLVDHYTKIEEKEDRYLYRIERLENTYASGMKMTRYGGIYRKNGLFHTIMVFLPEEKQKDYETKIIDMLKNAEFEPASEQKDKTPSSSDHVIQRDENLILDLKKQITQDGDAWWVTETTPGIFEVMGEFNNIDFKIDLNNGTFMFSNGWTYHYEDDYFNYNDGCILRYHHSFSDVNRFEFSEECEKHDKIDGTYSLDNAINYKNIAIEQLALYKYEHIDDRVAGVARYKDEAAEYWRRIITNSLKYYRENN